VVVLKRTISPLKVNWRFVATYILYLQGLINRERHQCKIWYLTWILRPWIRKCYVPPKHWLAFNGLNGAISQTITTSVCTLILKCIPQSSNLPPSLRYLICSKSTLIYVEVSMDATAEMFRKYICFHFHGLRISQATSTHTSVLKIEAKCSSESSSIHLITGHYNL
jgi:hypothetical protein